MIVTPPTHLTVALYARVSTDNKGQDADNQLQPIRDWVELRHWRIYQEYVDEISAVKFRPSYERLLLDAQAGHFSTIVVWKMDRFARSMRDFVLTMIKLDAWGIRFIATSQGIDTDVNNPGAKLMMNLLVSFAEFERSLIAERVKAGIAKRKRAGKPVGRQTRILPLAKIEEMHNEGIGAREIARILREPPATIIRRVAAIKARQLVISTNSTREPDTINLQ